MSALVLLHYSSKAPLYLTSTSLSKEVSRSRAPKTGHIYHYEAIEAVAKGAQPYLSLCLETSFNSMNDDEPRLVPLLKKIVPNPSERSSVVLKTPPTQPILTDEQATTLISKGKSSFPDPEPNPKTKPIEPGPRTVNDALSELEENDLISWTGEDFDTIDYKNTPDYDPDQDSTEYGTTSESEPESESFVSGNFKPPREAIDFRQYVQLKVIMGEGEVESSDLAPCLLILDIGSPLAPPDLDVNPELTCLGISPNDLFLHHFSRYPYLTADDNYIRKTAYVQRSSDPSAPPRYLIVQEFSSLGSRGKDGRISRKFGMNWELKRVEAKAWWRKEDRRGKGIRVGFYELLEKTEIDENQAW